MVKADIDSLMILGEEMATESECQEIENRDGIREVEVGGALGD